MIRLNGRGVLELKGEGIAPFLDNLLSNNVDGANESKAIYAALLGPQGKFLFDLFILRPSPDYYLIDTNHCEEFFQKLRLYKMRLPIEILEREDLAVFANFEPIPHSFPDPRNPQLGFRVFAPIETKSDGDFEQYEAKRLELGIPDPSRDLIRDGDFALEGLLDEMGAIDFHKGCFIGQEMTSRMKRRGTLKQKLVKIHINGEPPEFDTPIFADETELGRIRTNNGKIGLALLRIDRAKTAMENGTKMLAGRSEILIDAT